MRTIQQKLKKEITVVITINFIIIISQFLVSCAVKQDEKGIYDMLLSQKIETRDSLYVLFTIKEWSKNNWKTFEDYYNALKQKELNK